MQGGYIMEEKVLQNKKNGMIVLVVTSLLYIAGALTINLLLK